MFELELEARIRSVDTAQQWDAQSVWETVRDEWALRLDLSL